MYKTVSLIVVLALLIDIDAVDGILSYTKMKLFKN